MIFPTQESHWDLLHCRQILYQLRSGETLRNPEFLPYVFLDTNSGQAPSQAAPSFQG